MDDSTVSAQKDMDIEELFLANASSTNGVDEIEEFRRVGRQFNELMIRYSGAIREVKTKLEVLNDEFQIKRSHNPISYIKSRIKKPASIYEKLLRRGYPVSLESIEKNLHDVAGIRVICGYVQDIYTVADMLASQSDIKVLEVKDYIARPKSNGYRSLHLVVSVPVFFSDQCIPMKVEVQIRTIAMDFWATLEHQLKYKSEGPVPEVIAKELKDCSDVIAETDIRMQRLYNSLYQDDKFLLFDADGKNQKNI